MNGEPEFLTSFTAQRAASLAGFGTPQSQWFVIGDPFVLRVIRPRRSMQLFLWRIACAS